ncbi:hypothetical protein LT337_32765 (plasmid) [Mycolicibacterium fortuitum]|nr:hypothetical protein LT337_32765 [Mycolicibacterium fortuitum]
MTTMASEDVPGAVQQPRWWVRMKLALRIALVVVGIPAVWVARSTGVVDMSVWKAVVASVLLLLIAVGASLLALVLST